MLNIYGSFLGGMIYLAKSGKGTQLKNFENLG